MTEIIKTSLQRCDGCSKLHTNDNIKVIAFHEGDYVFHVAGGKSFVWRQEFRVLCPKCYHHIVENRWTLIT
jgi:hypothetical protein